MPAQRLEGEGLVVTEAGQEIGVRSYWLRRTLSQVADHRGGYVDGHEEVTLSVGLSPEERVTLHHKKCLLTVDDDGRVRRARFTVTRDRDLFKDWVTE